MNIVKFFGAREVYYFILNFFFSFVSWNDNDDDRKMIMEENGMQMNKPASSWYFSSNKHHTPSAAAAVILGNNASTHRLISSHLNSSSKCLIVLWNVNYLMLLLSYTYVYFEFSLKWALHNCNNGKKKWIMRDEDMPFHALYKMWNEIIRNCHWLQYEMLLGIEHLID